MTLYSVYGKGVNVYFMGVVLNFQPMLSYGYFFKQYCDGTKNMLYVD